MIHFPCMVDGVEYHNLREAHRAVFLPLKIGYDRFQRRLQRGETEFLGHSIKKIERRYELSAPLEPDSDGVDLLPVPAEAAPKKEHIKGTPLLMYGVGCRPLELGIRHYH